MENQLVCVHPNGTKKFKSFFEDFHPHLNRFLDYYFSCHSSLSPLMPNWLPHIMKGDAQGLKKLIEKELAQDAFTTSYDDYNLWSLNKTALPDCDAIVATWQPHAEALLGELAKNWCSKGT